MNPFIYDDPVPPDELIDRRDEVDGLVKLAEGGHNTRLQAPRRYGKTSVLRKVLAEADRIGLRTVYVDFLLAATADEVSRRIEEAYRQSLTGSVAQLLARVTRAWRPRAKLAPGGVGGEIEYSPEIAGTQRLADLLDLPREVFAKTNSRTLIVFDEFQDFLRAQGDLDGLLRTKIQTHRGCASYIFSGSEQALLEEWFSDRRRSLFDQARPLYLPPLGDEELAAYIAGWFARTNRDAGEGLEPLLDVARGHPQRAMLLAHHLWEQTPAGGQATLDTFEHALGAVDRETKERFEYTWQRFSTKPNQRRALLAIAQSPETLYNERTLRAFNLSKSQAQAGEKGLTAAGEVHRVDGRPQLIDPLLQRWLRLRPHLADRP